MMRTPIPPWLFSRFRRGTPPPEAITGPSELMIPLQSSRAYSDDELAALRRCLRFLIADVRGIWAIWVSWVVFFTVTFVIPTVTGIVRYRSSLLGAHDITLQAVLTVAGFSSFWSIRSLLYRHGLAEAMFLEELRSESVKVQQLLVGQLRAKYRLFYTLVGVCAILDFCYRVYWYFMILSKVHTPYICLILDGAEFLSFVYRVALIFVSSLLLQIHCVLQVLRMEDFVEAFTDEVTLMTIYDRQRSLETHLSAISGAHQLFIASLLVLGTATQLWCTLIFTQPSHKINLAIGSELILVVACLVVSLMMCLAGAIRITHEAQSIKRHAMRWHTSISVSTVDPSTIYFGAQAQFCKRKVDGVDEALVPEDDEIITEDGLLACGVDTVMKFHASRMAHEKRTAVLTFLEGYKGGISLYGFILDRNWLQALCMMQLSLVMWVLSKTVKL